jgi:hypothetical protein
MCFFSYFIIEKGKRIIYDLVPNISQLLDLMKFIDQNLLSTEKANKNITEMIKLLQMLGKHDKI